VTAKRPLVVSLIFCSMRPGRQTIHRKGSVDLDFGLCLDPD